MSETPPILNGVQRTIFTNGVAASCSGANLWTVAGLDGEPISLEFDTLCDLGVRPVIADLRHPPVNRSWSLAFPAITGRMLDVQLSQMTQAVYQTHSTGLFLSTRSFLFVVGGVVYHLGQLARSYAETLDVFRAWPSPLLKHERVVFCEQPPFFEFEALVSSIVRMFEMARHPLWQFFGTAGSTPRSFENTYKKLKKLDDAPVTLIESLADARTQCLTPAKEYRDCVHHYVDLGSASQAQVFQLGKVTHGLLVKLPDNPEARSASKFTFDLERDVLAVGWELASHAVSIASVVTKQLVEAASAGV